MLSGFLASGFEGTKTLMSPLLFEMIHNFQRSLCRTVVQSTQCFVLFNLKQFQA